MIEAIRELNENVEASMKLQWKLVELLERGDAKVTVTNLECVTRQLDDDQR